MGIQTVELTDYEFTLCGLFSHESAKTQQKIEFGQKTTVPRSVREIERDNMIGKMAEVAVAKTLHKDFGLHLPVNYEVYPRGECDDNDIVINNWSLDIKSTRRGRFLMLEYAKVNYRLESGTMPDVVVACKTPWNEREDRPEGKRVDVIGCISTKRLVNPKSADVYRLRAGECIPGTMCRLQAGNYAVRFDKLSDFHDSVEWMLKQIKNASC